MDSLFFLNQYYWKDITVNKPLINFHGKLCRAIDLAYIERGCNPENKTLFYLPYACVGHVMLS